MGTTVGPAVMEGGVREEGEGWERESYRSSLCLPSSITASSGAKHLQ